MAGDERPDLELPSFLGGRRRRAAAEPEATSSGADEVVEEVAGRPSRDLPPGLAVVVTGLAAGLVAGLLIWLAELGCEAVRGTSSCGGRLGFVALLLVLMATTAASWGLLRLWQVSQPVGTAMLALGLLAVVGLLTLEAGVSAGWLLVTLPVFSLVTHLVAHAVATAQVD